MLSTGTKSLIGIIVILVGVIAIWCGYRYRQQRQGSIGRIQKLPLNESLLAGVPPASCPEWQTISSPTYAYPPGRKCKVLGGKALCDRVGYSSLGCCDPPYNTGLSGTLDIGPILGATPVNQPIPVNFRLRDFGSGDATIYVFGKVDWGDGQQENLSPWSPNGQTLNHTYHAQRTFVINAMAGAQFKYSTPQVNGVSGSYEACQDNSITVRVGP